MCQLTYVTNIESVMNNDGNNRCRAPSNLIVQSIQIWTLTVGLIWTQTLKYEQ